MVEVEQGAKTNSRVVLEETSLLNQFIMQELARTQGLKKLGNKYAFYKQLVRGYVQYLATPPTKRDESLLNELEAQAREVGLPSSRFFGAERRAREIYAAWVTSKLVSQIIVSEGQVRTRRGMDPNIFLGDGSHRKSTW